MTVIIKLSTAPGAGGQGLTLIALGLRPSVEASQPALALHTVGAAAVLRVISSLEDSLVFQVLPIKHLIYLNYWHQI